MPNEYAFTRRPATPLELHQAKHLVHPPDRQPGRARDHPQVVAALAARVETGAVQHRADAGERVR